MVTHGHLSTCLRWSSAKLHSWFPQSHQSQVHPSPSCTFFFGNLIPWEFTANWLLWFLISHHLAACIWPSTCLKPWSCLVITACHQALTASLEYGRCRMSWQHIWLYALINGYGLIALCVCTVDVSIEHENCSNGSFCCDILWPLDHFDLHQNYPQKSYDPKIQRNAMYGLYLRHLTLALRPSGMCSLWWQSCFWKARPMTPSLLQLHNAIRVTSVHLRPTVARIRRMTHLIQQNVMRWIPHAFKQRLECLSCHKRSFTKPIQSGCFNLAVGILLDLEVISLFIKKKKAKFHEFETIKIQRKLKDSNHHSLRFQTGRPKFRSSPAAGLLTRQQIVVEAKARQSLICDVRNYHWNS